MNPLRKLKLTAPCALNEIPAFFRHTCCIHISKLHTLEVFVFWHLFLNLTLHTKCTLSLLLSMFEANCKSVYCTFTIWNTFTLKGSSWVTKSTIKKTLCQQYKLTGDPKKFVSTFKHLLVKNNDNNYINWIKYKQYNIFTNMRI